jgi:hypothetical protein
MKNFSIEWIHSSSKYDGIPQYGWVRVAGTYLFFTCQNEETYRFLLYKVPRDKKLEHLKLVRCFRNMVGWHCDYGPGKPIRQTSFNGGASKPGWRDFYLLPRPIESGYELADVSVKVGTTNLQTAKIKNKEVPRLKN